MCLVHNITINSTRDELSEAPDLGIALLSKKQKQKDIGIASKHLKNRKKHQFICIYDKYTPKYPKPTLTSLIFPNLGQKFFKVPFPFPTN
jgi:hypothetical protein